jgi:hypothetical protein
VAYYSHPLSPFRAYSTTTSDTYSEGSYLLTFKLVIAHSFMGSP